jgi:hypothetical protein
MSNLTEADVTTLVIDQHLRQQHLEHLLVARDSDNAASERNTFWYGRPAANLDHVFIALNADESTAPTLTIEVRDNDDEQVVETGTIELVGIAPELASAIVAAALLSFETLGRL